MLSFVFILNLISGYNIIKGGTAYAAGPSTTIAYGDLNSDGVVNITDLSILLTNYSTNSASADTNADGIVDANDLNEVLSDYGQVVSILLPAQILNLSEMKITLPIDSNVDGQPDQILQPNLATFATNPSFMTNQTGTGVLFRAAVNGVTTSGSSYPRSELREMTNSGQTLMNWSSSVGTNSITVSEAVTHLPVVKPQIIATQVHDAATDLLGIEVDGNRGSGGGTVGICVSWQSAEQATCLDNNYVLGTPYTIQISVSNDHYLVYYNGVQKFDFTDTDATNWFQTGCYTLSNLSKGDNTSAYGEVIIYNVQTSHT